MNRNKLKTYAPLARREFIQSVTDRAAFYGLSPDKIEPVTEKGDVAIIGGRAFSKAIAAKRRALEERIKRNGFEQAMEALAYTWFNRLVAIRFMELHGYLEHGYRVLSNPDLAKDSPEILEHAEHVDLPGLKHDTVIDLKLAGNKEPELYRLLLVAQCNALHSAMPFLFERIDDETELVLPESLLHSDSILRKLVNDIDEEDWQQVEIIGWLYQFYISEKKDEVIGKVVKSEDIPAATQLFTPNWIVKYLVQNTLGRQWLATYPQSALRQQMEYYIEPAEQTPEVQEQLKAITSTSLDPEELTLLDPACGSGHILVEAYGLLKAIYQERGYRAKDIPRLILEKNLFGLEIDDRAAQLAALALMMAARADDRDIFVVGMQPHVLAIHESKGLNAKEITEAINQPILNDEPLPSGEPFKELVDEKAPLFSKTATRIKGVISLSDVASLIDLFEYGKTFGSLIHIPRKLAETLPAIAKRVDDVMVHGALLEKPAAILLQPLVQQAQLLDRHYDFIVANPPYIGNKYMTSEVKGWASSNYPHSKLDAFSMFIERSHCHSPKGVGFVVPFVWMFISTFQPFRTQLLTQFTISSLVQLEYNAFEPACVPVCVFTALQALSPDYVGDFIKLSNFKGPHTQAPKTIEAIRDPKCDWRFRASTTTFRQVPNTPIAYWVSPRIREAFSKGIPLGKIAKPLKGMFTGFDARFVRLFWEVSSVALGCASHEESATRPEKWYPYLKGGEFRKWYGNVRHVVNFQFDGQELRSSSTYGERNPEYYFRPNLTWSDITSSESFAVRVSEQGCLSSSVGCSIYGDSSELRLLAGLLCSPIGSEYLKILNPTFHANPGDVALIPVLVDALSHCKHAIVNLVDDAVEIARDDWNSNEISIEFSRYAFVPHSHDVATVKESLEKWTARTASQIDRLKHVEEEINRLLIKAYGLCDLISHQVPESLITLYRPTCEGDVRLLISYAVGCMMGRYSLDKPGLIYAQNGNQGFDPSKYRKFPADADGIIPVTEFNWFVNDTASRFESFIATVWPVKNLEENLRFVASSIGSKKGESPRETIRRYLAVDFFRDHLQMYKGPKHPPRPIYWLFASGKQRGFQALVYLHRYNEGTLARMRIEYVIPLLGKIIARIEQLTTDITGATSMSQRTKLEKERDKLLKQQTELQIFDEELRHRADQRITLDLDDGVKVNYGRFGDLLAEVKTVTGGDVDE